MNRTRTLTTTLTRFIQAALALLTLATLTGCDTRVLALGQLLSLSMACAMFWATLNLDKARKS